ncbi:unnamed protein product [Symbiodinium sp. CCMP2592]|nr:unnamed protein product [Symbiodinium sp. CCMP2592]
MSSPGRPCLRRALRDGALRPGTRCVCGTECGAGGSSTARWAAGSQEGIEACVGLCGPRSAGAPLGYFAQNVPLPLRARSEQPGSVRCARVRAGVCRRPMAASLRCCRDRVPADTGESWNS